MTKAIMNRLIGVIGNKQAAAREYKTLWYILNASGYLVEKIPNNGGDLPFAGPFDHKHRLRIPDSTVARLKTDPNLISQLTKETKFRIHSLHTLGARSKAHLRQVLQG